MQFIDRLWIIEKFSPFQFDEVVQISVSNKWVIAWEWVKQKFIYKRTRVDFYEFAAIIRVLN